MINASLFNTVTPNAKLAMVGNRIGNPGLKNNQGSSVELYDYVQPNAIGSRETIRFFENVNTKQFPYSNLQINQLQVGEALSIQYIAFTKLSVNANGEVVSQDQFSVACSGLLLSQFSLLLDNSRILKINSLFNPKGSTFANYLFYPDTDLVIPPQISFTAELNIPANTDTAAQGTTVYYGCHLFGTGAILNLKTNV
jgi:hypothetical protein